MGKKYKNAAVTEETTYAKVYITFNAHHIENNRGDTGKLNGQICSSNAPKLLVSAFSKLDISIMDP